MKKSHYATINAIKCAVQAVVKLLESSLQVPKDKCTITKINKKHQWYFHYIATNMSISSPYRISHTKYIITRDKCK